MSERKPILVIGGGIAGMTAAVEAAEVGCEVILVEQEAFLGGRVMRTHRYFPKMCPPTCGFEINVRRMRQNPRITVHTLSTVEEIVGEVGDFRVKIRKRPRYVTGDVSIDDGVAEKLTSEIPNEFNFGMDRTKALYMPHDMAWPHVHVIDREALSEADAATLTAVCPEGAVDLEMSEERFGVEAGAIIVATGWSPYDATKLTNLGFGSHPNIVTNVMMERLAARGGPTGGEIVRPSDGAKAANVAFVQCAGSRDENHLPYCSAVCCMASLKQVRYLRDFNPESKATVFYIDIRTIGRQEKFYYDLTEDENVRFVKGKAAKIGGDEATGNLTVEVEDTIGGENLTEEFDLVVLATGVVPNGGVPVDLVLDEYGFVGRAEGAPGVFAVGCTRRPSDVSRSTKEATAAALKAIQCLSGEG
jgi:quinone-modifying oxidoreductase subunit QmoA